MSTSGKSDHLIVRGYYLLDEELRARLTAACRRLVRAALLFGAPDSIHLSSPVLVLRVAVLI